MAVNLREIIRRKKKQILSDTCSLVLAASPREFDERDKLTIVCLPYLDHGGHWVDTAQVLHDALSEVGHAQTDGPVGVALQLDHLVGTGAIEKAWLSTHGIEPQQSRATALPPSKGWDTFHWC